MIPASYMYKDAFIETWGDPRNMQAEPVAAERHDPRGGSLAGLLGLLAAALHLLGRPRHPARAHA